VVLFQQQRDPASQYTFDSERGASQSEICRDNPNSRECITVSFSVISSVRSAEKYAYTGLGVSNRSVFDRWPAEWTCSCSLVSLLKVVPWFHRASVMSDIDNWRASIYLSSCKWIQRDYLRLCRYAHMLFSTWCLFSNCHFILSSASDRKP